MIRDLVDDDGENRAVRSFLMIYGGSNSMTVWKMTNHMAMSGWSGYAK
jgi:hypothetical protein